MKKTAIILLDLYKKLISPWLAPRCRFYPTCSTYAHQSLHRHGLLRGGALTLRRLVRCHPYDRGPWTDPVPEAFAWKDLIGYKSRHSQSSSERE